MIYDLHSDLLTFATDSCPTFFAETSARFSKSIVYAVWTTRLKKPVAFLKNVAQLSLNFTAIEDLGFISPANLAILDSLMPSYASLTWNGENSLAGGAHTNLGLTERGKWVIELLGRKGIILDTAHLSRQAFFETLAFTSRRGIPIMCSHTCFDGVFSHPRNLTDRQIRAIINRKGIIGLSLVPEFMGINTFAKSISAGNRIKTTSVSPKASVVSFAKIEEIVRQIDYFVQKFGADSLAIGSDFYGTDTPALKSYKSFGWVRRRLIALGYSLDSVDKIFYKNAKNFLRIHSQKEIYKTI